MISTKPRAPGMIGTTYQPHPLRRVTRPVLVTRGLVCRPSPAARTEVGRTTAGRAAVGRTAVGRTAAARTAPARTAVARTAVVRTAAGRSRNRVRHRSARRVLAGCGRCAAPGTHQQGDQGQHEDDHAADDGEDAGDGAADPTGSGRQAAQGAGAGDGVAAPREVVRCPGDLDIALRAEGDGHAAGRRLQLHAGVTAGADGGARRRRQWR